MRLLLFLGIALFLGVATLVAGCQTDPSSVPTIDGQAYHFVTAWGVSGDGPAQLREPTGVAISGDTVFVSDAGNNRVQVFNRSGGFLYTIGGDSLHRPMHLETHAGRLYVPSYLTDRILIYSSSGGYLDGVGRSGAAPGTFDAPAAVAVMREGRLAVVDFYNHRVQIIRPDGRADLILGTGTAGSEPGQFSYPTDVAVLPDGGLVVADAYNHRIQAFDPSGVLRWVVPDDSAEASTDAGRFNVATAIAIGPDERVFVADFFNHRIQIFSGEGDFLSEFGTHGSGEGQFDRPADIAVDSEGLLYIADFGNDRIQVFEPAEN